VLVATACGAMVVALNRDFYLLCLKRRGPIFAAACVALHFLYFIYASVAFGVVVLSAFVRRGWSAAPPCPTEVASPATGVGEESPAYGATASPPVV
jgi:hypothetical protein